MASVSKLSTLSLSAMILASAGSSALAMDFNDKFYGKAQAGIGYSAGFYSGDVKNAIDEAKTAGEKTNKTSHSIKADVGFNVFYKATDKINPFVGLNVEGKYAFNNEFVKNSNFQNFLNVNAKLGSSFKVSKDLNIRPYALVGMSVNQYKTKEQVNVMENANVNMLYGTAEQNANGKYDAALAYVQYMFIQNVGGNVDLPFDIDSVKVYASSRYVVGPYTNVEKLGGDNGMDLNDFISTLKNLGFTPDYPTIEYGSSSNFTQFMIGNNSNYLFLDFSNAEFSDSDNVLGKGKSVAELKEEYENDSMAATWMTSWLQSQIEQDAPSNVKGWVDPSAQTENTTTEQNAGTENTTTEQNAGTENTTTEQNAGTENQQVVEPTNQAVEQNNNNIAENTNQNNTNNENKARSVSSTKTSYNVGLNVGAGIEFVIKDRFTVGVEYRYTDVKVSGAKFQLHNIGAKFGVEFL